MPASDSHQARSGLSVSTLIIASASSLAAALVVSKLWGGGTLIGAATTPVIVALVSEGLRRPARAIDTVRTTRAARFDPIAEGRRGLAEGDLDRARRPQVPAAAQAEAERRVHRASGPRLSLPRPRVIAAIATGLVAFVVAGVVLTGSELVFGNSSVASSARRTTFLGGAPAKTSAKDKTKTTTTTTTSTPTTSTPTASTSTAAPKTTTTAPPTATTTSATPPPTVSTAPPAPPASTVPAAPAPSATPPPATTTP